MRSAMSDIGACALCCSVLTKVAARWHVITQTTSAPKRWGECREVRRERGQSEEQRSELGARAREGDERARPEGVQWAVG